MEQSPEAPIRLTQYSHGSGCGCKIAPLDLERILANVKTHSDDPRVIVGNQHGDDAAVIDLGDDRALVTTTDFFMPIVDDPYDFGRIAAANAVSDVYAMGGEPLSALAILGWPIEALGTESAGRVLEGARAVANEAGISISGGHSIESKEPFFGLSVNGLVQKSHVKTNGAAVPGDLLYLTKPIGIGILSTAMKRGMLSENWIKESITLMCKLNDVGAKLGKVREVHAMTDVTGFGLLGHLIEMCEASQTSAEVHMSKVPVFAPKKVTELLASFVVPDNTMRNFKAYHERASKLGARELQLLCDPQTSGGLLIAVDPKHSIALEELLLAHDCHAVSIGRLLSSGSPMIQMVN